MLKTMNKPLADYIAAIEAENHTPDPSRIERLKPLIDWIRDRVRQSQTIDLVYICTHNSRRSHFGQVWGKTAAHRHGLSSVRTWSGGTEATAFHPNAMAALSRAGFQVSPAQDASVRNALYHIHYDEQQPPIACFSKTYDDAVNPAQDFVAVMTCTDAEKNCPFISGASLRVGLPYEDPRFSDGTPQQEQAYDLCCRTIARESLWLFAQVKSQL